MKLNKGRVRGKNSFSNALNKPIEGKLAEKKSPKSILVFIGYIFDISPVFNQPGRVGTFFVPTQNNSWW